LNKQPVLARWFSYLIIILLIINFGAFGDHQFIYFQF
jgi:hypothetical protein